MIGLSVEDDIVLLSCDRRAVVRRRAMYERKEERRVTLDSPRVERIIINSLISVQCLHFVGKLIES